MSGDELQCLKTEVAQLKANYEFLASMGHSSSHLEAPEFSTPASDATGSLTKAVYDSSATTAHVFGKMKGTLSQLQTSTNEFSRHATLGARDFGLALQQSTTSLNKALQHLSQITNGASDEHGANMLKAATGSLNKANFLLLKAMRSKNSLENSIQADSKKIAELTRKISTKTQKSLSVLSVSDKICENAKLLQSLSKSVADKAERIHLANASPGLHKGVEQIHKIVTTEAKFIPYKPWVPSKVVPLKIGQELEKAAQYIEKGLDRVTRAMGMSPYPRLREVVDIRNEVRHALHAEDDAMHLKTSVTDATIRDKIVATNTKINSIVDGVLRQQLRDFSKTNDEIVSTIDPNKSNMITSSLSRQVAKTSDVGALWMMSLDHRSKRRILLQTMESITYPTFTIPTFKCCSLILTFDDIAEILGNRPHIVQVGMGEISRSSHLVEMQLNWLFSPDQWPLYVSGFNPAIHEQKQVFQYELASKKIQFTTGTARISMTHQDMILMLEKISKPCVHLVSLLCEEPDEEQVEKTDSGKSKVKRKIARRNQCFADSVEAMKNSDFKFVLPQVGSPTELVNGLTNVVGWTGTGAPAQSGGAKQFVQIRQAKSTPETILETIREALKNGADVLETDFPFHLAKEGLLLNERFEIVDIKNPVMLTTNEPLLVLVDEEVPRLVSSAASHMKSYIHHLFRCEELSGPILLATVNLFQFDKLVSSFSKC